MSEARQARGASPFDATSLVPADVRETLVALRREIHAHPELSFHEHATAERLVAALTKLGIADIRRIGDTGVVARVAGRERGAPAVAVRGDIDALPITEGTGLPYASRNAGVMHACGHDVHATWAVGAAALLARQPARGDVVVILQPAEEQGNGALAMIEGGALDGVSAIFGGHVDRRFAVGQVVADTGPLAASADTFTIEVRGRGAHAARPHESADPIVAASAIVLALQTIVSRRLNPATAGVVTIGSVHGGSAPNVIPEHVTLTGTVRAIDPEVRRTMLDAVRLVTESTAAAHGVQARADFEPGTPPIVNPAEPIAWARAAVARLLGEEALVPFGTLNMAGEDFAHYMARIPGCFLRIGAREPGGAIIPAHSPTFHAAEESIFVGAAVLAETAREASERLR
jgi:amidohydrolase